jgi:hypothetical protein
LLREQVALAAAQQGDEARRSGTRRGSHRRLRRYCRPLRKRK